MYPVRRGFTLIELLVARHPKPRRRKATLGFTLIELLVVMAILGILATAVVVAINPGKRSGQARDAIRKSHINAIANALIGYYVIHPGVVPKELYCDSSLGSSMELLGDDRLKPCSEVLTILPGGGWHKTAVDSIYPELVTREQFLKDMPKDPINNTTYFYVYEPNSDDNSPCDLTKECSYWIGARLEAPADPLKPIFRCTDIKIAYWGTGCKEISLCNSGPIETCTPTTFGDGTYNPPP